MFNNRAFAYVFYYIIIWHYPRILQILGQKVQLSGARYWVNNYIRTRGLYLINARNHLIVQTGGQELGESNQN